MQNDYNIRKTLTWRALKGYPPDFLLLFLILSIFSPFQICNYYIKLQELNNTKNLRNVTKDSLSEIMTFQKTLLKYREHNIWR